MKRHLQLASSLALALAWPAHGAAAAGFYAREPEDLWNRTYAALLVRTTAKDVVLDDLVDPPLWFRSRRLLDEPSCKRLTSLLDEMCNGPAALAARSPLQRAFMQRDLLGVYSWLIDHHRGDGGSLNAGQRALGKALARTIRHVALDESEIRRLPSNFAAPAQTETEFDPANPSRYFFPKDILADDSPWIAVEPQGDDWMPASVHFKVFRGRSSFDVRFRHPKGRPAGEDYLREIAAFPKPITFERPASRQAFSEERGPWINPDTPQFPTNSAWALVRRAMLADREGRPVLSPIVESVQIRVYRRVEAGGADAQAFFEWELTRDFLRGGPGLRPSNPQNGIYSHHFFSKQFDPFEEGWEPAPAGSPQAQLSCQVCHDGAGIQSVHSRSRVFELGEITRPPELRPVTLERIAQIAEIEARQLPAWQLLPWLQINE